MKPIVILNSGGFDSTVMLYELLNTHYPKSEVHTLFFDYGQNNVNQERRCAKSNSEYLNCIYHEVIIPPIMWSKNNFYGKEFTGVQEQYLEMRNLIFLSYALSLCESVGADKLYAAFMRPPEMNSGYCDASVDFVKRFDDLVIHTAGVHFYAPLMEYEKEDLIEWVRRHKITPDMFFTCDTPVDSKRCGTCTDCKTLFKMFPKTY